MNLNNLTILKEKIIAADDFQEPWIYFLDNFGESQQFLDLGYPTKNKRLEQSLVTAVQQILPLKRKKMEYQIIKIPKYHFYHGAARDKDIFINFIFFEDSDIGMLTIATNELYDTKIIRFSMKKLLYHQN